MILKDGIILYHGSFCAVQKPNLLCCKDGKDFGKGFYLTTDKNQASAFVHTTIRKKIFRQELTLPAKNAPQLCGYVSQFVFHANSALRIFEFDKADETWLECVSAHRMQSLFSSVLETYAPYDIIAGKIANDKTNPTITLYLSGAFGNANSVDAKRIATQLLLPDLLSNQLCFKTERALASLEFCGAEEIAYVQKK